MKSRAVLVAFGCGTPTVQSSHYQHLRRKGVNQLRTTNYQLTLSSLVNSSCHKLRRERNLCVRTGFDLGATPLQLLHLPTRVESRVLPITCGGFLIRFTLAKNGLLHCNVAPSLRPEHSFICPAPASAARHRSP